MKTRTEIFEEISQERENQNTKWGEQNHNFEYNEIFSKAFKYANDFTILLLGTNIFKGNSNIDNSIAMGYLTGIGYGLDDNNIPDIAVFKYVNHHYDLSGSCGSWSNIINKHSGQDDHKEFAYMENHPEIEGFWADAHNNTKFNAFKYYNDSNCAGS